MPASLTSPRSRRDLRGFLELLEHRGALRRITAPVDPDLELAAIADRVLAAGGPGLLYENVIGSSMPVAINLLGTQERVLWSLGMERPEELEALGERLGEDAFRRAERSGVERDLRQEAQALLRWSEVVHWPKGSTAAPGVGSA